MDLIDKLREIASRIPALKQGELVKTEEGTKNALIMPFINALGYDVFNPLEVTPELIADVGTKKGEKVDYAILKDGKPIILMECKGFGADLGKVHASQLYRYFSVTSARFGVLTNGVVYRFYSDLIAQNKMDDAPFFVFDLLNITESTIETLKRFTKSAFDETLNLSTASNLKYRNGLRTFVDELFREPSDDFVRFCVKESKVYAGIVTQSVVIDFKGIIREVLKATISEQVENRLKSALASNESLTPSPDTTVEPESVVEVVAENKILTTQDEIDAFFVIKSIVREVIPVKRITMRDAQSYCSILIDDNNRKMLCRLYFNQSQKRIAILDEAKNEQKYTIATADDIYQYAEQIKAVALKLTN